jgi:DNA-damage-inducible protein J
LFARAVINYGGIPFDIKAKQLNSLTLDAIRELENEDGKKVTGVDQLFKALGEGKFDDVSA